ncbi:response regulator [Paucibacter sp. APW11]|uniref:Response regulator n=1 Tax=Roseateles aquae TaxID=3077235 RepID=A0ABU3PDQ3_9BURK|nr:response regulator [Paucibacter sp. APW11]MDT9000707.1 response regulator [Paucibacter sp. APW11]
MTANDGRRHVLVVEDEPKLASLLCDYLHAAGYVASSLGDGQQALAAIRAQPPAVLLLDLMLPGMDGLELCRQVRQFSALPILMLSARVDELDRLLGLELGADDYLCKPYSPREVVARVRALLRRAEGRLPGLQAAERITVGPFCIDDAGLRLFHGDRQLPLTPLEFRLLRLMLAQPGRVFSRAQLLEQLHEDFRDVSDRVIDSHVKNIRRKLAALEPAQDLISAVYGQGYRLDLG